MPARLTVHFPSRPARVVPLPDGRETVIGRDAGCDVVLDDERVSRRHAVLAADGSAWSVTDLASKNGTLVDGVPVTTGTLKEKSWLSFGGLVARFEAGAFTEEPTRSFSTSLELRRGLAPELGLAELLPRVVASMIELTSAERGFVLLADAQGELAVAARSGPAWEDLQAEEFSGSLGAVQRVLATGETVVAVDTRADAELGERASVIATGIRALLCVPVHALDRLIGVMYADSRQPGKAFTELDLEILEALAAQAGLAIAVARLDEELKGLAHRISATPGADDGLRDRLAGEVSSVLERSLRPPTFRPEALAGALAAPPGIAP